jgi:ketosteroid isomerase-like protein
MVGMDALAALRVMTDSMDAYDRRDFDRLAELYAEDVRWLGTEPRWDCEKRDDVFSLFRSRMESGIHVEFDEIRATPSHVILTVRVGESEPVVSVFTIADGRITHVQDHRSREAAEAALV